MATSTGMRPFTMKYCKVMQNLKRRARLGGPAARLVERPPVLQNDEESRGASEEGSEGEIDLTCVGGLGAQE